MKLNIFSDVYWLFILLFIEDLALALATICGCVVMFWMRGPWG